MIMVNRRNGVITLDMSPEEAKELASIIGTMEEINEVFISPVMRDILDSLPGILIDVANEDES
jgi:hypothetical protein